MKDPEAAVLVKQLAESSVDFQLRGWVKTGDYWDVYLDPIEAVKKEFDAGDFHSVPAEGCSCLHGEMSADRDASP